MHINALCSVDTLQLSATAAVLLWSLFRFA